MQGNTTEIDERNLLRLDALLSHGYGLSPQLVMRSKGLSIEAKALYGYLSSFAGAGDTAFPSTSRILEELDISKNRFYKIRKGTGLMGLHLDRDHGDLCGVKDCLHAAAEPDRHQDGNRRDCKPTQ